MDSQPDSESVNHGREFQLGSVAHVNRPCEALTSRDVQLVQQTVGETPAEVERITTSGGTACIWKVSLPSGQEVYVKRHRLRDQGRRELGAYELLAPLPKMPRLLGTHDDGAASTLALSRLLGTQGNEHVSTTVLWEAGAWLAALHQVPVEPEDSMTLAGAYARRIERALSDAKDIIRHHELSNLTTWLTGLPDALHGARRCWTHRDYVPRNWLVHEGSLEGVIDFEHARLDVAAVDFARIETELWVREPDSATAFLEGYEAAGGELAPRGLRLGLAALDALVTHTWGVRHHDRTRAKLGREALEHSLARLSRA